VIVWGIASGGDTIQQKWSYNKATNVHSILEVHKKISRPKEAITWWNRSTTTSWWCPSHKSKINTHRVRRILIDTGSSANVMYFDVFYRDEIQSTIFSQGKYIIGGFHWRCNGTKLSHTYEGEIRHSATYHVPHNRLFSSKSPINL
jgi:hypothetical protein